MSLANLRRPTSAFSVLLVLMIVADGCVSSRESRRFTVFTENDFWGLGARTDKHYTNGLELEYSMPLQDTEGIARGILESDVIEFFSLGPKDIGKEPTLGTAASAEPPPIPSAVTGHGRAYANGLRDGLAGVQATTPQDYADSYNEGKIAGNLLAHQHLLPPPTPDADAQLALSKRFSVAFGQQFYTPQDTSIPTLIENDRPYAAWLYMSFARETIRQDPEETRRDSKSTVKLVLGIVGPSALGEETQNGFHKLIDDDAVEGWSNQLKDEPGLLFNLRRDDRIFFASLGACEVDAISHVSGVVGNVLTQADLGTIGRIGYKLPRDWSARIIAPEASQETTAGFATYLFGGVDGRLVLRDIFLDGNSFRHSHSVDKEPVVADFSAGVSIDYRGFGITYTYVHRTQEFEDQDNPHRFGSLSLHFGISF